jgi:hypothetical protein
MSAELKKPSNFEVHYFSNSGGKWIPVSDMCDEHIRRAFKKLLKTEWYAAHFTDDKEYVDQHKEELQNKIQEITSLADDMENTLSDIKDHANDLEYKLNGN